MPASIPLPGRNRRIDWLRGSAIILVVIAHVGILAGPDAPIVLLPAWWFASLQVNGALGVSLFFTISGYIITRTSLLRYGTFAQVRIREFLSYRMSRILPPLLLLVGVNLWAAAAHCPGFEIPPDMTLGRLLGHVFTFRFNLLYLEGGSGLLGWAVLWSLAVEEVFYLLFPLAARLLRSVSVIAPLLIGLVIIGPYWRLRYGSNGFFLYLGCFDQLAVGCLSAILANWVRPQILGPSLLRAARLIALAAIAVTLLGFNFRQDRNWVWMPSVIALGAGLFLFASPDNSSPPPGRIHQTLASAFWPLGLAGLLSYELYLFHLPLMGFLYAPLRTLFGFLGVSLHQDLVFLIVLPLFIGFAYVLHRWYSEPLLRSMRRALRPLTQFQLIRPIRE